MLRSRIRGFFSAVALLLLVAPAPALAYTAVTIDGGTPIVVTESYDSGSGNYYVDNYVMWNPGAVPGDLGNPANDWKITINAYYDYDPQIIYAM
jgi:hypothetical protein